MSLNITYHFHKIKIIEPGFSKFYFDLFKKLDYSGYREFIIKGIKNQLKDLILSGKDTGVMIEPETDIYKPLKTQGYPYSDVIYTLRDLGTDGEQYLDKYSSDGSLKLTTKGKKWALDLPDNSIKTEAKTEIVKTGTLKIEVDSVKPVQPENKKLFEPIISVWWLGNFHYGDFVKKIFSLKKSGKISKIKIFVFIIVTLLIALSAVVVLKPKPAFSYTMLGKSYQAKNSKVPTVIEAWFDGNIKNVSAENKSLERIQYVVWQNKFLGKAADNGYLIGQVYEINADGHKTPVTIPILFQPNEAKHLGISMELPLNNKEKINLYAEKESEGFFSWAKNDINLLFEDSRGNIFDESGKLVKESVIDSWLLLPNNKGFSRSTLSRANLYYNITIWKVQRLLYLSRQ